MGLMNQEEISVVGFCRLWDNKIRHRLCLLDMSTLKLALYVYSKAPSGPLMLGFYFILAFNPKRLIVTFSLESTEL